MEREIFTEIIHNYVNPVSDNYIDEIGKAIPDYKQWNKQKNGYSSSISTFNEYMTWAIFSLYVMDNYQNNYLDEIISFQEDFMVAHRKFIFFKEFNQQLMELYTNMENKTQKIAIEDFYPAMLKWAREKSFNKK